MGGEKSQASNIEIMKLHKLKKTWKNSWILLKKILFMKSNNYLFSIRILNIIKIIFITEPFYSYSKIWAVIAGIMVKTYEGEQYSFYFTFFIIKKVFPLVIILINNK